MNNTETEDKIQLWHGGRNLNKYDLTFRPSKTGRWEYGPGLYLTTHYETAHKYAKGGGKTYLITLEKGEELENKLVLISDVIEFANTYIPKSKIMSFIDEIYDNARRMKLTTHVEAETMLNLIINDNLIKGEKTKHLNDFLKNNNIDYSLVNRFGGRNETIMVLFNLDKITNIEIIPANKVDMSKWELEIPKTKPLIKPTI